MAAPLNSAAPPGPSGKESRAVAGSVSHQPGQVVSPRGHVSVHPGQATVRGSSLLPDIAFDPSPSRARSPPFPFMSRALMWPGGSCSISWRARIGSKIGQLLGVQHSWCPPYSVPGHACDRPEAAPPQRKDQARVLFRTLLGVGEVVGPQGYVPPKARDPRTSHYPSVVTSARAWSLS